MSLDAPPAGGFTGNTVVANCPNGSREEQRVTFKRDLTRDDASFHAGHLDSEVPLSNHLFNGPLF